MKQPHYLNLATVYWHDLVLWCAFIFLCAQWVLALPRIPIFNYDEAFMVEPAWHLATSGRPASCLLVDHPRDLPYGMNYPLFSTLMAAWIKLFGFDLFSVRLLPFVLVCAAAAIAIWALLRMNLLSDRRQVLLLLILWMLTHPAFYAAHHARPEGLTLFVFSLITLAATFRSSWVNLCVLTALSVLIPYCGLHMIVPAAIALVIAGFFGYCSPRQVISIASGIVVGAGSFYLLYQWTGAWESFQFNVKLVGGLSIKERLANFFSYGEQSFTFIQSHLYLLLPWVMIAALRRRQGDKAFAYLSYSIGLYCVAVMIVMRFVGNVYVWYAHYNFLVLFPLLVLYVVFFLKQSVASRSQRVIFLCALFILLLQNNYAHSLSYSHLSSWKSLDPNAATAQLLSGQPVNDDVVIGTEAAYMPLRPRVHKFYSLFYVTNMASSKDPPLSKSVAESVTMIVTDLSEVQLNLVPSLQSWCGGDWTEVAITYNPADSSRRLLNIIPCSDKYFAKTHFRIYRRLERADKAIE
jgi:hypothetical protein